MKEIIARLDRLIQLLEEQNKLNLLSKEFLSLGEVARYMGVSKSHVEKLTSGNRIKYSKPGGKNAFVKREWLLEYLSSNEIASDQQMEERGYSYMSRF